MTCSSCLVLSLKRYCLWLGNPKESFKWIFIGSYSIVHSVCSCLVHSDGLMSVSTRGGLKSGQAPLGHMCTGGIKCLFPISRLGFQEWPGKNGRIRLHLFALEWGHEAAVRAWPETPLTVTEWDGKSPWQEMRTEYAAPASKKKLTLSLQPSGPPWVPLKR